MTPPARRSPALLLASLLVLSFLSSSATADLAADAAALLALRAGVLGASLSLSWNSSQASAVCSWRGVVCSGSRVTELHLPGRSLRGTLPAGVLSRLSALQVLSLRNNALTSPLPDDLGDLPALRNLYLQGNQFSGEIPVLLANLSSLVRLDLAANNFSGQIPAELGNLTKLVILLLDSNELSGEIPSALGLPHLSTFNVSYNAGLNGSIPTPLRTFAQTSFLGTGLCGGPLGPCPGEAPAPSPAAEVPGNPSASTIPASNGSKAGLSGGAIAGIVIGSVIGLLILLAVLVLLCRKCGRKRERGLPVTSAAKAPEAELAAAAVGGWDKEPPGAGAGAAAKSANAGAAAGGKGTKKQLVFFGEMAAAPPFDLEDLLRASAEVLGKGVFGTAYKAVLENGSAVAVKRLKDVDLPEAEFRTRVAAVGAVEHELVVPLRAYYFSKDEKLLVYDFMPMGSLSALLHGNRALNRTPLDWPTRLSIALSAARAVEYIHSTGPSVSHGNIKSSNVLLTKSYKARVSDHGLVTLVSPSFSAAKITGYRAPEVTDIRRISQKADVYSFGVLLLELLTGKAPSHTLLNEEGFDLPRWVRSVVRDEWTSEVFDSEILKYNEVEDDMVQLLKLAMDCTEQHPDKRPAMSTIVSTIDQIQPSGGRVDVTVDRQGGSTTAADTESRSSVDGIRHEL